MAYKLIIRPRAEKDLSDAFAWYEAQRRGLGHDFLLQVEASLNTIATYPLISSIAYRDARIKLIRRFPYKVIYLVREMSIIVIGVIHNKRHPGAFQKRI